MPRPVNGRKPHPPAAFRTDDGIRTARKMAYNDVLQYARRLLNGG